MQNECPTEVVLEGGPQTKEHTPGNEENSTKFQNFLHPCNKLQSVQVQKILQFFLEIQVCRSPGPQNSVVHKI